MNFVLNWGIDLHGTGTREGTQLMNVCEELENNCWEKILEETGKDLGRYWGRNMKATALNNFSLVHCRFSSISESRISISQSIKATAYKSSVYFKYHFQLQRYYLTVVEITDLGWFSET